MSSYLLYEPNNALRAFSAAPELQSHIFNPRGKIAQIVNFLSVSQNSDLSLKLNLTRQHKSRGMLGFQNRVLDIKILKFDTNRDNSAYLEKCNFNESSFSKSEASIGFVESKQV